MRILTIGPRQHHSAQTHEQRTALAGQIGRALAIFCVDEIVIFEDGGHQQQQNQRYTTQSWGNGAESAQRRQGGGRYNQRGSGMNGSFPKGRTCTFDESNGVHGNGDDHGVANEGEDDDSLYTGITNPSRFLARLLSFLETPPHLRRALFPLHPDLRNAGTLPSLAMPHHLKADEWCPYREGVVVSAATDGHENIKKSKKDGSKKRGRRDEQLSSSSSTILTTPHLVNVGFPSPLTVNLPPSMPPSTRLTVHLTSPVIPNSISKPTAIAIKPPHILVDSLSTANIAAVAVPPTEPRDVGGYYWGYAVRQAASLSAIFTECPYAGGYDVSFGTSERGVPLSSLADSIGTNNAASTNDFNDPSQNFTSRKIQTRKVDITPLTTPFRHLLLVFGGVAGLENALDADEFLSGGTGDQQTAQSPGSVAMNKADTPVAMVAGTGAPPVTEVSELFDFWVNLVPGQGSRTIRTEEAVLLGLMGIKDLAERVERERRRE